MRDWLRAHFAQIPAAAVVNATAFSAVGDDGSTPFDASSCPVFQVALSTARREDWVESLRGLSPGDLAMHVVLPEVDGRLFAGVVSFKSAAERDPDLQFSHLAHRPDDERVKAVVARVAAWRRLAEKPASEKRLAIVLQLSGRPHQIAHAVGLDALASVEALLSDLARGRIRCCAARWPRRGAAEAELDLERCRLPGERCRACRKPCGTISRKSGARPRMIRVVVRARFISLPSPAASRSSRCSRSVANPPRAMPTITISPARRARRYVAFYLWLRRQGIDAVVHMGAHGTLEWLPRKIRCAVVRVLAGSADRRSPNDLSLHRQRSRRGGAGQAAAWCCVSVGHLPLAAAG